MSNVIILAAGKGSRMHSKQPKVLQTIGGLAMIDHVVRTALAIRPTKIIVVVGHQAEIVKQHLSVYSQLEFVEQTEQLGTGHAVKVAASALQPGLSTLVLYGDVPLIQQNTLIYLLELAQKNDSLALLTTNMANPKGYGRIVRDQSDEVLSIVEEADATESLRFIQEVNTGLMAVPYLRLMRSLEQLQPNNAQQEYYLTDIIALSRQAQCQIKTHQPNYDWEVVGVNNRSQQAQLERTWQTFQVQQLLEQGVQFFDPSRVEIRGQLQCGQDVQIDVNTIFEGHVVLADGVQVSSNCYLKNVNVAAGVVIEPFTHIENAEIGQHAVIGPFARLRPGSVLGDQVRIGNFVELKKSQLGAGTKVNHLSYVGDALVGERVNIGAGTIFCNYDGANKHQTVIGDDVFIGSGSQLVAPVEVQQGATIGAGTTLTKTAPANSLTLSRAKQVSISGWSRPIKTDVKGK